ncbi:hypothetical protein ACFSZS_31915 [Seohaeicola zhoushanensis]
MEHWGRVFGADNLLVLPQEVLRNDPAAFLSRLTRFLGLPGAPPPPRETHNVGLGGTALRLARPLNALYLRSPLSQRRSGAERAVNKTLSLVNRLSPKALDRALDDRWKQQIEHRYRGIYEASNRRLAEQTGEDLAALGYPL